MANSVKIPKKAIKDFFSIEKIDTTGIITTNPVLSCLKIECKFGFLSITKSNLKEFVVFTYSMENEQKDFTLLIQEDIIKSFSTICTGDFIEINISDSEIEISDGYLKPIFAKELYEIKDFPKMPKLSLKDNEKIKISKQDIQKIGVAKNFLSKDELRPTFMYIHIKNNIIFSTDAYVMYINKVNIENKEDEEIILSKNEALIAENFDEIDYSNIENFSIIKKGYVTYGSLKKDKVQDIYSTVNNFLSNIDRDKYMLVKKQEIENFVLSTIALSKKSSNYQYCKFEKAENSNKINLSFSHEKLKNNLQVSCKDNIKEHVEFFFSQEILKDVLKFVPYEDIKICVNSSQFVLFSDEDKDFTMLITKFKADI